MKNAFLVKPKTTFWQNFRTNLGGGTYGIYYSPLSDLHLYVPETYVMGNFRDMGDKIQLKQEKNIFYNNSKEFLQSYHQDIDEDRREIVKPLWMPKDLIDLLEIKAKIYGQSRKEQLRMHKEIGFLTESIDQYNL